MIGQIPSLFDPSMAIPPDSGLDYQQWVENYANGQYAYAQQAPMPGNVSQVPYQQQPPPQSQLHHVQTSPTAAVPAPAQNRYNFVQEFAPGEQAASTYDTHTFVRPATERPTRGMPRISRQGGASANVGYPVAPNLRIPEPPRGTYQQPQVSPHHQQQATFAVPGTAQGTDSYFYGTTSVAADVIPGSADQQQQQRHHSNYHFVQQQYPAEPYSANSYTPNSDFTNLPSSVSTPSVGGTDDSQHAFSSASSHLSQQAAPQQQPQASSSRQTTGSAGRGRGRGGAGGRQQKRQRHNDPDDDGDSDTQSDDEQPPTMAGLNMTVSVPPPQGQNSLPARL